MRRTILRSLLSVALFLGVTCVGAKAGAAEPYLDFLRGLQERGYGEQALFFLDSIAEREDVPVELKRTLTLERSRSLRIAAIEAYDAEQRQSRLDESKKLLDKFIAENPNHPAAAQSMITWGDDLMLQGQMQLGVVRGAREKDIQDKARTEAKAKLSEAQKQFDLAVKQLKPQLNRMPKAKNPKKNDPRMEVEITWLEGRFKLGLVDYLLAQTYSDPKDKARIDLLKKAAKGFDSIFQEYRLTRVAFLAHMWHGKTIEEQGDALTAMDIYDEVLVATPEGAKATIEDAPLFGQAQLFRMQMLAKSDQTEELGDMIVEGEEWLKDQRKWISTPVYQGVALELAKARIAAAEKANATEKKKLLREAIVGLAAIGKVESEYRQEALLLRRELADKIGTGEAKLTYEESLALADQAASEKSWEEATEMYNKAVEIAKEAKDDKKVAAANLKLGEVRHATAVEAYTSGKLDQALTLAGAIVRDSPQSPVAQEASSIAIAAALDLYAKAAETDKEKSLYRLQRIADFTIKTWPDSPVADDARMAMARTYLLKSEPEAALKLLDVVNEQSKRYGTASQIAGQIRWKEYLDAKKRSADDVLPAEQLTTVRDAAIKSMRTSYDHQKKEYQAGTEPMPDQLFDTQLLLAEMLLEQQQMSEAATLYAPLVEEIKKRKPKAIDLSILRTFIGAVRANMGAGEVNKAGEAAVALMEFGEDTAKVNAALVDFSKLIGMEVKKTEAAITETEGDNDAAALEKLRVKLTDAQNVSGQILDKLAERKDFTVAQLLYLGDASAGLKKNEKARDYYDRMLKAIENDEDAKKTAAGSITRVRSKLLGLLRNEGRYEEARKQVDALIKDHPNALEPLMEKGRILQDLATRDPKRYDDCIAHWTEVRVKLGAIRKRPPEYYEVLYNAAFCLVQVAQRTKDGDKALQAEQMLKSTLTLSPNLSGPDMVAKYNALATRANKLRGTLPTATKERVADSKPSKAKP